LLIKLPDVDAEGAALADRLMQAHKTGMPWNDMAILYRSYPTGSSVVDVLERKGIPFEWLQKKKGFRPDHDSVKVITLHSSKGLEFPFVGIAGLGLTPTNEGSLEEEARLLYVGMTRATNELIMTYSGDSVYSERMQKAMNVLQGI
jgi:superfamily I DNA/RNA helicase